MKRPDTPFPRHWRYYIVLKYVVSRRRGRAGAEIFRSLVMPLARERLYLFDTTLARRRADQRRRFHARPTSSPSSVCSTSSASITSRAAIPAPIRPTRSCSPSRACCTRPSRRSAWCGGPAARPRTIRASPRCSTPRPGRSASSPSPGIITCGSRWRRRSTKISPRSATAWRPPRPRAARCCSTASISSTATRPIRPMRWPAPRRPTRRARAGWCCATPTAARCRTRSRRSSRGRQTHSRRSCRHPRPQ